MKLPSVILTTIVLAACTAAEPPKQSADVPKPIASSDETLTSARRASSRCSMPSKARAATSWQDFGKMRTPENVHGNVMSWTPKTSLNSHDWKLTCNSFATVHL